jgi:hypothetical protein
LSFDDQLVLTVSSLPYLLTNFDQCFPTFPTQTTQALWLHVLINPEVTKEIKLINIYIYISFTFIKILKYKYLLLISYKCSQPLKWLSTTRKN